MDALPRGSGEELLERLLNPGAAGHAKVVEHDHAALREARDEVLERAERRLIEIHVQVDERVLALADLLEPLRHDATAHLDLLEQSEVVGDGLDAGVGELADALAAPAGRVEVLIADETLGMAFEGVEDEELADRPVALARREGEEVG